MPSKLNTNVAKMRSDRGESQSPNKAPNKKHKNSQSPKKLNGVKLNMDDSGWISTKVNTVYADIRSLLPTTDSKKKARAMKPYVGIVGTGERFVQEDLKKAQRIIEKLKTQKKDADMKKAVKTGHSKVEWFTHIQDVALDFTILDPVDPCVTQSELEDLKIIMVHCS